MRVALLSAAVYGLFFGGARSQDDSNSSCSQVIDCITDLDCIYRSSMLSSANGGTMHVLGNVEGEGEVSGGGVVPQPPPSLSTNAPSLCENSRCDLSSSKCFDASSPACENPSSCQEVNGTFGCCLGFNCHASSQTCFDPSAPDCEKSFCEADTDCCDSFSCHSLSNTCFDPSEYECRQKECLREEECCAGWNCKVEQRLCYDPAAPDDVCLGLICSNGSYGGGSTDADYLCCEGYICEDGACAPRVPDSPSTDPITFNGTWITTPVVTSTDPTDDFHTDTSLGTDSSGPPIALPGVPEPNESGGGDCNEKWAKCGGKSFTGSSECCSGFTCQYKHEWYSQCRPPPPVDADGCSNKLYAKCGGKKFNGQTCCPEGAVCHHVNDWYSQCKGHAGGDDSTGCKNGAYSQCGGNKFHGATCCPGDTTCRKINSWYSQCRPAA